MAARRLPPVPPPPPRKPVPRHEPDDPLVEIQVTNSVLPVPPRLPVMPSEVPTNRSSQNMRLYGSMLALFDALESEADRTDLVELNSIFVSAPREDRFALLQLARKFQFRR